MATILDFQVSSSFEHNENLIVKRFSFFFFLGLVSIGLAVGWVTIYLMDQELQNPNSLLGCSELLHALFQKNNKPTVV